MRRQTVARFAVPVSGRLTSIIAGLAASAATGLAQDSAAAASAERPVTSGVYTDAQARRGEASYKVNCLSCHSTKDYSGDTFKLSWVSRTAFDIFDLIRTQMPEDTPGILPRQEYVDIVAYMFSLNGYQVGAADLPPDDAALKLVRIDTPPGSDPAPAPAGRFHQRR